MKQNRSKTKTVVRVIAFLLVAALLYGALSRLLAVNDATEQQYIHSFYLEPKNSLDVMILGASETFTDYCAPLAWQHAGFTSYPLAVSAAQGTMYPSMLREAAKRQTPGVYVVEVNGFLYTAEERDEFSHAALRKWIDTIPLSANKLDTIRHVHPGREALDVLLPAAQIPHVLEVRRRHPPLALPAAAGPQRGLLVHQAVFVHLHVPHGNG